MPNHCHCDLYINGPKEDVAKLLALVGADKEEPEFSCEAVIPYPKYFDDLDKDHKELSREEFEAKHGKGAKDGFNSGGYELCRENWGTKWGAYNVKRRDYGVVCITFQSAWSPPSPVIVALHKMFPMCDLHLEYFESGCQFCGGFSCMSKDEYSDDPWEPGTVSQEWEGEYKGNRGG